MINSEEKAIAFLKIELKKFIDIFPQTRVRYEYDMNSIVHTIEVVPNEVYHLNGEYISWENAFTEAFIQEFPDQNICFVSDDSLAGIDEIQLELFGRDFQDSAPIHVFGNLDINTIITRSNSIEVFEVINTTFSKTFNRAKVTSTITTGVVVEIANGISSIKLNSPELFDPTFSMAA